MDCSSKIQLPNELLSELANAFRFDFRWSVLRVSSSIFDHFLAKRQQKILQNVDLYLQQRNLGHLNVPLHEAVIAARALAEFHTGNFKEMYAILQSHEFPRQIQPMLQKMLTEAYDKEAEPMLGRRKIKILREYYLTCVYPCMVARNELAQETGLRIIRVARWFRNQRSRDKKAWGAKWSLLRNRRVNCVPPNASRQVRPANCVPGQLRPGPTASRANCVPK
ncbi:hypothetical protein niasHT_025669 [Heterodera trifolii]|uniref:Homeobox domain-containing protein n=1 Tax=Heterodera trifolii TaxID=157864 RepID=A0ABD2KFT7_9BILA